MVRHFDNADRVHPGAATVARLAAAGILAVTAVAGCASGGSPAPATPASAAATSAVTTATNSAALCAAASEFQTAANAIVHIDASAVGVDGVKAALQQLRTAGANLATAAGNQMAPQVDSLQQALNGLQTTIGELSDQSSLTSKLGAIAASVAAVEQPPNRFWTASARPARPCPLRNRPPDPEQATPRAPAHTTAQPGPAGSA